MTHWNCEVCFSILSKDENNCNNCNSIKPDDYRYEGIHDDFSVPCC